MVGYRIRVPKEKWFEDLINAKLLADGEEPEVATFVWTSPKEKLTIQDDYLIVDLGNRGWIDLDANDFTAEMIEMIIELNPKVATEAVLTACIEAISEERKAK